MYISIENVFIIVVGSPEKNMACRPSGEIHVLRCGSHKKIQGSKNSNNLPLLMKINSPPTSNHV